MATADELLLTTTEQVDKTLTINFDTRTITIPGTIKVLGVESDDDVHRLEFRVARYYCEFDLSEFDIRINYMNAKGSGDMYIVDDLAIADDNETMTFTWLVDRFAFREKGDVKFIVCMKKYDDKGEVVKEFNTTIAKLPVLEGLETETAVISSNTSLFDQLLNRLYAVEAATGMGNGAYYNVIKMTENEDGVVFTIVNQDGETEALVKHGEAGYSPVRGVDYWTADDQSAMKTYIDTWAPHTLTATLLASGWNSNQQTVRIPSIGEESIVIVAPEPTEGNYTAYNEAMIRCVSQATGSLTFQCEAIPSVDLIANIAIFYSDDTVDANNFTVTDDGKGNVTIS